MALRLALTLLWERQHGGQLTHGAYENLGRVPGSLGRYAEEVWSRSDLDDDKDVARQLFLRLVQISSGGEVTRRVATSDDLGAPHWRLAQRLATTRLLVTGRDAENRETVELAHEALVDGWARLRGWIDADREFLAWQEQFDRQLQHWKSTGQDQGGLLRGVALAAAEEWLRGRPGDLTAAGRQYVELSRGRQRREVRRLRVAIAVFAVLVLAAGALAGTTLVSNNRLDRQLNSANARTLAEESMARATEDPATATQLALAAWRADPESPQARTALGRQYLAMQSVDGAVSGLSDLPVDTFQISQDGRVMLLEHSQGLLVVTEPLAPEPQRWMVPGVPTDSTPLLSPDGRWLTAFDSRGILLLWDVHRRSAEVVQARQSPPVGASLVSFSPDSRRLVWLAPATPDGRRELVVWNVAERTRIPYPLQGVSETNITGVWLTDDPDLAMFRYNPLESEDSRLVVRELTGGTEIRTMPPGSFVVQGGKSVISCNLASGQSGLDAIVSILRSDTGAESLRFPLAGKVGCSGPDLYQSVDRNYLVEYISSFEKDHTVVKVISLSDGSAFDVVTPPQRGPSSSSSIPFEINQSVGVFQSGNGQVTMLFARGPTLFRMNDLSPDLRGPLKYNITSMSDNGRYLIIREDEAFTVLERDTGQELGRLTETEILQSGGLIVDDSVDGLIVSDSVGDYLSILATMPGNRLFTQYSLPDLEPRARYILPTAVDDIGRPGSLAVVGDIDNRLLVALAEGLLSVWSTKTITMIGEPVRLGSTPEEQAWYQQNAYFVPRPGHPNQIAILAPDGNVELWDMEKGQSIRKIPTKIDMVSLDGFSFSFDKTGDRLVHMRANSIEVWDVEKAMPARVPIAAPDVGIFLGFDSANRLVAQDQYSLSDVISFWDLETGRKSGSLRLGTRVGFTGGEIATVEDGQRIEVGGFFDLPYKLPITAEQWFDHLCGTLDRGFTESERDLLPPGTDPTPPCSTDQ